MGCMNGEIKDKKYQLELLREIEIKEARSLSLLQEIQYLKRLLKQVEQGLTREEIKQKLEHNPFDDFDFFGWKGQKR